ncbi:hypothetical protein [Vulcanisaeta distributa]|uniref:Uncharacterized protein n=1 Tax=Vulcanisaeta distributa (strain DSM 14429 / JCM 11212 / NBRC 100878 / IC-017) TaxID=572478 RepID=E1QV01_VULDI|nr:hypothetical protein [Vulcanisaeta distributa]ADN51192.1 hypothetical protein Vdis_1820 [Vulcanisaeta distributa DSM 14429]
MNNIPDACHWDRECITNSIASVLIQALKGSVPKDLANNSAFRDLVRCDNKCTLPISDYSIIRGLDEASIRDGVVKVIRFIDLGDIPDLVQLLINMDLEPGIVAVDENVDINIKGELGARVNEALGIALYSIAAYDNAITRFSAAAAIYEGLGNVGKARFMEAMSKIARAEDLRVRASRLHEEGNHDAEKSIIEDASKLYASSVVNFREAVGIEEARANEVLSMMDSSEVLANYYFTHGDIARAMQYYDACRSALSNIQGLGRDYWNAVKIKGDLCSAFYLLCKAIEEGDWRTYEEAGDKFLELIGEGLIDELTTEGAVMSYRGAIDGVEEVDDAIRIYSKYVKAVSKYFDNVIKDRYGSFETFIEEFRKGDYESLAHVLNTDINTLKLYVVGKIIMDVVKEEGFSEDTALEVLAYLAGLGLNPLDMSVDEMIEELHGFIVDEDFLNRVKDLLIKIKGRLSNIVSKQ